MSPTTCLESGSMAAAKGPPGRGESYVSSGRDQMRSPAGMAGARCAASDCIVARTISSVGASGWHMTALRVETLTAPQEIRQLAPAWDRLWERSAVTLPTVRAELVAGWLEHFAPRSRLAAVVVWQGNALLAALPLVERRIAGVLRAGDLTSNFWSPNGELLVDTAASAEEVLAALVQRLAGLPWRWLWLDLVPAASGAWPAFTSALAAAGMPHVAALRYAIGQVATVGDFAAYECSRSKNLRRSLCRDLKRLQRTSAVVFHWRQEFAPHEVEPALRAALAIEQRSWKAARGQSVLDQPRLFEFYVAQCRQLAAWGQLRIATLEHAGRPIAFELGWLGKGVYHSFKAGFDEAFRAAGPGQLLRWMLLERCFQQREVTSVDFQGPLTEALAAWATQTYPLCRLVVSTGGIRGRTLVAAYCAARRVRAPWRNRRLPRGAPAAQVRAAGFIPAPSGKGPQP